MKIIKIANDIDSIAKSRGYNVGPVFHGRAQQFNAFENQESIREFSKHTSPSFFFTESPDVATAFGIDRSIQLKNPRIENMEVYISLHNPIDLTKKTSELIDVLVDIGENREDLEELGTNFYWQIADDEIFVQKLIEKGHDGAICDEIDAIKHFKIKHAIGALTYAVFSPSQIKLADTITYDDNGKEIPINQRFDANNADIRY